MKNNRVGFFVLLTVAAAWAVAGCQVAEHEEGNGAGSETGLEYLDIVMSAQQEGDDTRTGVTNGGTTVSWTAGDAIAVFCDGRSSQLVNSSSHVSEFTGNLPVDVTTMSSGTHVWGLYPYNASATFSNANNNDRITTVLPAVQTAKAGSFDDNLMILVGKTALTPSDLEENPVALSMAFKNVCSGVRFKVTRSDIKSVIMTAIGGENLCGTIQIGLDGSSNPTIASVTNGSSSIVLNAPGGGTFATNQWYYFVTLPGTLSQGATFTMNTATKEGIRTVSSSFALARKVFCQADGLDSGITFEDLVVEVQVAGPDTWVAVDELNRALPDSFTPNIASTRSNRQVMMFYWPWHCEHMVTYLTKTDAAVPYYVNYTSVVNVTGIQWFYPEALTDPTSPNWGAGYDQLCFWGEPLFGYYRSTDPWVLRKHAEMLADAGVDAVVFDCTNGSFLWEDGVDVLLSVWRQARRDGVNVPKIAFLLAMADDTNTSGLGLQVRQGGAEALRNLYNDYYRTSDNDDMWFYVDNKPLVMAYPGSLQSTPSGVYDSAILDRFTFRPGQGDYVNGDLYGTQWGWLQVFPHMNTFRNGEEITVSVAQNARDESGGHCFAFNSPGTYGRSYTYQDKNAHLNSTSYIYGYNFQEQWDNALREDTPYIFVTGWNEWVAIMQRQWPDVNYYGGWGVDSGNAYFAFADQYDAEHSRDIEPTINWEDDGDNYYYQLAKNVRKYKGVSAYPNVTRPQTISIDGNFSEWESVSPDFKHYSGNTMHRAHLGHTNGNVAYFNNTGRNDIVDARVTRDASNVYFYVETAANISPYTDVQWMRLLINKDMDWSTGWKGYDYCVNYVSPSSATKYSISRYDGDGETWVWTQLSGTYDYRITGNKMELSMPRSLFSGSTLDFAFKWCDNNLYDTIPTGRETRILNLYVDGDAAPGGRFNFHYVEP